MDYELLYLEAVEGKWVCDREFFLNSLKFISNKREKLKEILKCDDLGELMFNDFFEQFSRITLAILNSKDIYETIKR